MPGILVVDDDAYIRELVCTLLRNEGFTVEEAASGPEALAVLGRERVTLCVLDIMMPGMDGYEVLRRIREDFDFPVLMLTAMAETGQKVHGFTLGADDYLTKPFAPDELVVRVRALLRRYQVASSQAVTVGRLRIDKGSHSLTVDGSALDIPLKEFELLFLLASYPGRTLSRDRLLEEIWGYDYEGNERTLDVHVGRLRERFSEETAGIRITTIRGLGYRLEVAE